MPNETVEPMKPLLIAKKHVKLLYSCSAATIDRIVASGRLVPIYLPGSQRPRYRKDAVVKLLDEFEQRAGRLNPGAAPEGSTLNPHISQRPGHLGSLAGCAA